MIRLNLLLLAVAVVCGLATVTAQHRSRTLFMALEREQALAREYQDEWGRLQLEQVTWAMHSRVEHTATERLRMQTPGAERVRQIALPPLAEDFRP